MRTTLKLLSTIVVSLQLTATLLAASPRKSPQELVLALYTEVLSHQPNGIPDGIVWDTFAPYFSTRLLRSIDQSSACAVDWRHQDTNPALTDKIGGKFDVFLGNGARLQSFDI